MDKEFTKNYKNLGDKVLGFKIMLYYRQNGNNGYKKAVKEVEKKRMRFKKTGIIDFGFGGQQKVVSNSLINKDNSNDKVRTSEIKKVKKVKIKQEKVKKEKIVNTKTKKFKSSRKNKFNFNIKGFFSGLELKALWVIIPTLLILIYVVLEQTELLYKMGFEVGNFVFTGYNFFLSDTLTDWLTSTKHNLFTAITLGLVQIVLIAVGFIIDLVLTVILFVLNLLFALVLVVFQYSYVFVIPALLLGLVIYKNIKILKDDPEVIMTIVCVGCLLLSIVGCFVYYTSTIAAL